MAEPPWGSAQSRLVVRQRVAWRWALVAARSVGGMADTVFHRDYSARPPAECKGYVFHQADSLAIESALSRTLGQWFGCPAEFR